MVGVAGFELATPCTPCKCATRLRYTPTRLKLYTEFKAFNKMRQTKAHKGVAGLGPAQGWCCWAIKGFREFSTIALLQLFFVFLL